MGLKERIGIVISNKPNKTIIVAIQTRYHDLKYSKILTKTKHYMAHDEKNICKMGDLVLLQESIPYSRHKNWCLKKVLKLFC